MFASGLRAAFLTTNIFLKKKFIYLIIIYLLLFCHFLIIYFIHLIIF